MTANANRHLAAERDALATEITRLRESHVREVSVRDAHIDALKAERDVLAKQWKDLKDWAFYSNALTNDDSARMLMYMRETEKS
jgi:cell division protein FtsB